jgi:hypothetical protein
MASENSIDEIMLSMVEDLKTFSKVACAVDTDLGLSRLNRSAYNGSHKSYKEDFENMQRCMILAMSAYYNLENLAFTGKIVDGNLTPFFHNMDSMEVYYPKQDLELENLELLLTPGYSHDDKYDQMYKVIKLKKGNKSERSKVKSKIMVHDGKISLKYIAYGVMGKKIDVVLEYDNDTSRLLHLDYSGQKKLNACQGREFKTFGSDEKIMLRGETYHTNESRLKMLGSIEDSLNPLMIIDDVGSSRLNLAAIGGEALLETDRYIKANYNKIIESAKK